MISTAKNCNHKAGFSLLEIVIVLAISSMVLGAAVGLVTYSSDEDTLRKASTEVELLAKRARAAAILQQTPYALEIRQGMVKMMPWAQAGRSEKRTAGGRVTGGESGVSQLGGTRWELPLASGMDVSIRRWNSNDWLQTPEGVVHVWRFDPNGLCEPISLQLKVNKSSMSLAFHPLTAVIRESEILMK